MEPESERTVDTPDLHPDLCIALCGEWSDARDPALELQWTDNYLLLRFPALQPFVTNGFVRGLCTGLGLLDLWIGFAEAVHYHEENHLRTNHYVRSMLMHRRRNSRP